MPLLPDSPTQRPARAGPGSRADRPHLAANGVPVWILIAQNESHGFAKKESADRVFHTRRLFLEKFLLEGK